MYLKSISIKGFKSFAKNINLDFEQGVTMIIGPNGSGKSNITDAVQWVLGEQSPRTLRSGSMQDVIFAGSLKHKALSLAEVTLNLDNSDHKIALDFSEITVTRRILRSGENFYYINQTPCRLLDVYELLHDSGLGRDTHSIIGQGKLEELVNSKPEEKRVLLEEAAGVLKHKRRKERAKRKLLSAEQNINRVKDILKEIEIQIKPLRHQVDKAIAHKELTSRLKELEVAHIVNNIRRIKKKWEKLSIEEKNIKANLIPLKKIYNETSERILKKEKEYQARTNNLIKHQQIKDRLNKASSSFENIVSLQKHKEKSLNNNSIEVKSNFNRIEENLNIKKAAKENITKQIENIDKEINRNLKVIASKRKESECISPDFLNIDKKLEQFEKSLQETNGAIKEKKELITRKENHLSYTEKEINEKKHSIKELKSDIAQKEKDVKIIEESLSKTNAEINKNDKKIQLKSSKLAKHFDNLKQIEKKISKSEKEKSNLSGKLELQKNLHSRLKPNSLKQMCEKKGILTSDFTKILNVEAKYIKAVDSYLRNLTQGLIVETIEEAKKILNIARAEKQNVNILIKNKTLKKLSLKKDIFLSDAPLWLKTVLSNVVIIESLEDLPRKAKNNITYVTLSGEIYKNGILKANYNNSQEGFLGLKNEIKNNEVAIANITKKLDELKAQEQKEENQILKIETAIATTKESLATAKENQTKLVAKKEHLNLILEKSLKKINYFSNTIKELEIKKNLSLKEKEQAKHELVDFEVKRSEIEKDWTAAKETFKEVSEKKQNYAIILTELNYNAKNLRQQKLSLGTQNQQIEKELRDLETHNKEYINKIKNIELTRLLIKKFLPVAQMVEKCSNQILKDFNTQEVDNSSIVQLDSLRKKLRSIDQQIKDIDENTHKIALEKSAIKSTLDNLADRIIQEHNMALETAINKYSDIETKKEDIQKIRNQLNKIGPVNEVAKEQFNNLDEREKFLKKQIEDLRASKNSINKIIRAIDKKIRNKLSIAFEEIKENFGQTFSKLFPGGKAELVLTDDDIFESGLEIKAQPYGKSLKKLSLLSGGEKSLTSLALLFAIYNTRSSPFYILDEVEAALDDINLQRFIKLLEEMKTKTQFVIITHQRRTMEVADNLYGVTMQADGVSKVVSQKISKKNKLEKKSSQLLQKVSMS